MAILAAVLGMLLAVQALLLRRSSRTRHSGRATYLGLVAAEMLDLRQATLPTGFARISGRFAGMGLDLQAVPDLLSFRKLPALWLLVTLPEALPLRQRITLMVRPRGIEPFSLYDELPVQTDLPMGFPPDATLRSEVPLSPAETALLVRHRAILDNPRVKELVLSPRGLRITWLAEETDRSRYLLFRSAEMGATPLSPRVLDPITAALSALRADILHQNESMPKCA